MRLNKTVAVLILSCVLLLCSNRITSATTILWNSVDVFADETRFFAGTMADTFTWNGNGRYSCDPRGDATIMIDLFVDSSWTNVWQKYVAGIYDGEHLGTQVGTRDFTAGIVSGIRLYGTGTQYLYDNMYFGNNSFTLTLSAPPEPVPEPTTIALLGIGLAGIAGAEARRRRKKKAVDKS